MSLEDEMQQLRIVEDAIVVLDYIKRFAAGGEDVDGEPFVHDDGARVGEHGLVHAKELLQKVDEELWERREALITRT